MAGGVFVNYPLKAIYTILFILLEAVRFPTWLLKYTIPALRPHREWSYRQALMMRIVKSFLQHSAEVRVVTPTPLTPGREGKRFVVLKPVQKSLYTGPAEDAVIKPVPIGATWTRTPLAAGTGGDPSLDVVLHFHGGAFVIGDGRDHDTGFLARTILKHAKFSHVVTPQYRLSSNAKSRFPAQLQDAIASYAYLLYDIGIPPSRITFSGDSAGGNLAIALLRYISEHGSATGLPWPGAAMLWSPWVDMVQALDQDNIGQSPRYPTDYLNKKFGHWGAETMCAHDISLAGNAYLSPLNRPFRSRSPVWIQTGDAEVLYEDDLEIEAEFRNEGTTTGLFVSKACPHDIILTAHILGFQREAEEASVAAGLFVKANRLVEGPKL